MSDESTPLTPMDDTSNEVVENTSVTELETTTDEPKVETVEADNQDNQETAPEVEKLYGGKYKSVEDLEKGYKEAEKAFSRSSELEKQLEVYKRQEEEAKLQRETEARQKGFETVEHQELDLTVKDREFRLYADALNMTYMSNEQRQDVTALLSAYQQSGGTQREYLDKAMAYFDNKTVSAIAQDVALFKVNQEKEFSRKQGEALEQKYSSVIEKSKTEYPTLHEHDSIKALFGDALQLTRGDLNIERLNKSINDIMDYAVEKYIAKQNIKEENDNLKQSLSAPNGFATQPETKKWLTRDDYNNLTSAEEDKMYDLINEQIALEKAGKLPRQLT